jgi:hypothetical protein
MAFIKKNSAAVEAIKPVQNEIDAVANIAKDAVKLSTARIPGVADMEKLQKSLAPKGRDFDAEARGKTRCALEEAWAQSPLIPMLLKEPHNREELHALLDEIVSERMKRIFPNG